MNQDLEVIQIPVLLDNYSYILHDKPSGKVAVVDCPDAAAVAGRLKNLGLKLTHIFCTHHHWDHVGGNAGLLARYPQVPIFGSAYDSNRIPYLSQTLGEGDEVELGRTRFRILTIPGHTLGHIAYVTDGAVFCGDTLFVGGCGRLFEGTPAQMVASLAKLKALPGATRVYCGHEYTEKNLKFASQIEPQNECLSEKIAWARQRRVKDEPTVPSTLEAELSYNPFLRWDEPALMNFVGKTNPVEVFTRVRALKDRFV